MTDLPKSSTRTITRAELMAMHQEPEPASSEELAALQRLLAIAHTDTGQARRVAGFLLAWWNADSCGAFDLTDLWAVDSSICADMLTVVGLVGRVHKYPDSLGYGPAFERVVRDWRPDLTV